MLKNKSVNGLRGLAALSVVINHFVAAFTPSILSHSYIDLFPKLINMSPLQYFFMHPFVSVFYNGEFAVIVFFCISGYVLTLPYFEEEKKAQLILRKRLISRYLRLNIPIFFAVLISYYVYKSDFYFIIEAAKISGSMGWVANFWPSKITIIEAIKEASYQSIIFGRATLVPPLWSLKIEFVGSIYVLLYYIAKPKYHNFILIFPLFFLIYALHGKDSIYFYSIFFGSMFSYFKKIKIPKILLILMGLYFGGFQYDNKLYNSLPNIILFGSEFWEIKSLYNTFGAALLVIAVINGFGSKFILSNFIQRLGKISFSIYLIHFILLCSVSSWIYISIEQSALNMIINFALYLTACIFFAGLFERFIDENSILIARKFGAFLFRNGV